MNKRFLLFILSSIAATLITICSLRTVPLIPRSVLFGDPVYMLPQLSPDGAHLAFIAPVDGTLNLWVQPRNGTQKEARILTHTTDRNILHFIWSQDNKTIIYRQDISGDENWHLYSVNIHTGSEKDLTPFSGVQARIIANSPTCPDELLIGLNKRDARYHDVYKLTISTGTLQLCEEDTGTIQAWVADSHLDLRALVHQENDGSTTLRIKENGIWVDHIHWTLDDSWQSNAIGFSRDGSIIYIKDSSDSDTNALVAYDIQTRTKKVLYQDPEYDIAEVYFDSVSCTPEAVSVHRNKKQWHALSPKFKIIFDHLNVIDTHGALMMQSSDLTNRWWTIAINGDKAFYTYYMYDTINKTTTHLGASHPNLLKYHLAYTKPISCVSRDGLTLHGYLTLPQETYRFKKLPLVVFVHGGPWDRDKEGYLPVVQLCANRGYAVLRINYRGSLGYGKNFIHASYKEWGGTMHNDLIDAVNWAIKEGIADPKKIAIFGASYGGYAALVGATQKPDIFCCAIDLVGPTNLITFIEGIPPYWQGYRSLLNQSIGNPTTDHELLKTRSPFFHANNIKIPLLIAQGAHDPRVQQAESEQFVAELKKNGIEHEYYIFHDEGHGLLNPKNRITFFSAVDKFLARYLGGRYEK